MKRENKPRLLITIGIGLLFPLFFQLSGGIYNSDIPIVDSDGIFSKVPLPISIFVCFAGILIFLDNYRRAFLGEMFIAGLLFVMLVSLTFSEMGLEVDRRKVILMLQYLLPTFGLILGQMIIDDERSIPRAFLYTLLFIVPVQLVSGWVQGTFTLTHDLYLFSIYSHFQYVPLILVCAFSYTMAALWESHKYTLCILAFLMLIYALASASFLTIFAYVAFITIFIYTRTRQPLKNIKVVIMSMVLVIVTGAIAVASIPVYYGVIKNHVIIHGDDGAYFEKFNALASGKIPVNVQERLDIWELYNSAITENTKTMILGHNAPLPREVRSSAHNWFLDIIYSFGVISLLPIFLLIGYTAYRLWQSKETLSGETMWLSAIVFYLVVVDDNFKVTLRQPYPGIFAYFLWGLLLSHIPPKRIQQRARF